LKRGALASACDDKIPVSFAHILVQNFPQKKALLLPKI